MKIQTVPIGCVKPYENNPRKNDQAVDKVAASINEFGFQQPIVVDRDMVVVVGHTRLKAALSLGMAEVPVHVASNLSPEQCRAYRLMDNRSNEDAEWDFDRLAEEPRGLEAVQFPLEFTGFDEREPQRITFVGPGSGGDGDEPPPLPTQAVARPGDLFVPGPHRLLCGDATSPRDVARLMDGRRADLVFTDPPYNVDYTGKTADALKIVNDTMGDRKFRAFLLAAFQVMFANAREGAPIYVCHADTEGYNFRGAIADAGWLFKQAIVWVKDSFVMGRQDYHWRHEPILYGWKPGTGHTWAADRTQDTVWEIPRPKRSAEHPTMKPVELVSRAIVNSSKPGAMVLDPFGGSGSTLIACESEGRVCRIAELDPRYVDVIVERWETFTGGRAELVRDGSTSECDRGAEGEGEGAVPRGAQA
ncbi:MAG TPA: DNA modification methylase [Thermodesulfobacteriota bacterium]|nr:DNA modification methylase [Thermodesulfobacteriota bacterium]